MVGKREQSLGRKNSLMKKESHGIVKMITSFSHQRELKEK